MAILQTSTVCLMILMRHSCIKHCIFLISFFFLNHSLTFSTISFISYFYSLSVGVNKTHTHTHRRERPAHTKNAQNYFHFSINHNLYFSIFFFSNFYFTFVGSSWGSSCTRNSPLTHTHTHSITLLFRITKL